MFHFKSKQFVTLPLSELEKGVRELLDQGRGLEAAYWAAYYGGVTPLGANSESGIGRAALSGLHHRTRGEEYLFNPRDYD